MDSDFPIALEDICGGYSAFKPPRRVTVAQGAADVLVINQPGGYVGPWAPSEAPYMVEPMNMLASRRHESVVFVGPARSGKTLGLVDGWAAHVIAHDPGDMLIVQMTQDKAREYSKTRIDRAIRHSPQLAALLGASGQDDNTHDKSFRHGMWMRIAWPTVSNLSSSDYRYVAFTDYDRMPDDINGEGAPFALGLKRTQTFLSRGMCMVESSPGRELLDPNWRPATPHEAPPVGGVLGIYNRSDRRRWYWQCPHCAEWFEASPGLGLFGLPSDDELIEQIRELDLDKYAGKFNRILCPHCTKEISPKEKHALNQGGRWLGEGQMVQPDGTVIGDMPHSTIAGYWMGGVAAAYQPWKSLIMRYLQGLREYALNGSELTLQATVNTDQGRPYLSRRLTENARGDERESDDDVTLLRYVVPAQARFLIASVDVQGGQTARFIVQVHAVGAYGEKWIIDRYEIRLSVREGMGGDFAPLDPAAHGEDWDLLTEKVVRATYKTEVKDLELQVHLVVVDTGGEDGVTDKAYAWYRRLRERGLHQRVMLVKGASAKEAAEVKESWVGNRNAREKGDVPIFLLNTNRLKDRVSAGLKRTTPGPGYIHIPGWFPKAGREEFRAEVRQGNGTWMQIRKRNESFDLAVYCVAGELRLGVDKIKDWANPPHRWARVLAENSNLMSRDERREYKAAPPPLRRRVSTSSYLD